MVKKVIDIFPPKRKEQDSEGQDYGVSDDMPSIAPYIETPAKPKITFIASQQENKQTEKKSRNGIGAIKTAKFLAGVIFVSATVALALLAIDAKYARAIVIIRPEPESIKAGTQVFIDSKISSPDKTKQAIPGIVIAINKDFSTEFKATGKKTIQTKAKGSVKIFNNYTLPQKLVNGTRLQAPLDKFQPALNKDQAPWFRTVGDIAIEPKSSIMVDVVADSAGEQYNIAPSVFSVPGLAGTARYTFIYAQSSEKFTGGSNTEIAQITQGDLDNGKNLLNSIASDQIKEELRQKTPSDCVLIPETISVTISDAIPSASAGATQDKFDYKAKISAAATAFHKDDLDNFGKDIIQKNIANGFELDEKSLQTSQNYIKTDPATGQISISLSAQGMQYSKFDQNLLQKTLAGKSASEAHQLLLNAGKITSVQIKLTPFWRTILPKDSDRIAIQEILD